MPEARDPPDQPEPPPAPELPRRTKLYPGQWLGIPLLVLIPVLSLLGVFGPTRDEIVGIGPMVRVELDYPARIRRGERTELEVRIRNLADQNLPTGSLIVDPEYMAAFSSVSFLGEVRPHYRVELPGLSAGGATSIRVEMEAMLPWRRRGTVVLQLEESEPITLNFVTFVFP